MKTRFEKKSRKDWVKKDGSEAVSSKPSELRAKIIAPTTLRQKMNNLWNEFRMKEAERDSVESLADAVDFDVDNDEFLKSPYESEGSFYDTIDESRDDISSLTRQESPSGDKADAVGADKGLSEPAKPEGGTDV